MQEITQKICDITAEGVEKQLKDTRDGQFYWVGKMKDGSCWMLQNLALGSTSASTVLTSSNSDVSSNWTLPASKAISTGGSTTATAIQSWNFGKWVLATPLLTANCSNSSAGQTIANCTKVGFVDVSSSSFSAGYTATTRSWDGANSNSSTLVTVNCTSWSGTGTSKTCTAGTYDAHYLVGNYYSWNAATAGTGGSITSGNASGSICPKGWELPTSGTTLLIGSTAFVTLLGNYGVDSSLSGTANGATYNIAGSPLRFVRGGNLNASGGYVQNAGQRGYYWSSRAYSSAANAYRLDFDASGVNPAGNHARYMGYTVRCVAQSLVTSHQ